MTVVLLGAFLDYLIGDPWGWLHPVQVMGWGISFLQKTILKYFEGRLIRKVLGIFLGLFIIVGSGIISWEIIFFCDQISIYLSLIIQSVMLASCFAGKSLIRAGKDVLQPLTEGNLLVARQKLSLYVGRDTENLSEKEVYRAILETIAENTTDGVTAPLFYALLGVFIPVIGCVPMAIAYKASSTLDSMIGYKKEPYIDIGWFSAKLEDILTWFPCRLTVLTLAMMSGKPFYHLKQCRQDAKKDPSPNSGWSEAIYASILEVQLGGKNTYQGEIKFKPLLGKPLKSINIDIIKKSFWLTRACFLWWLCIATWIFYFPLLANYW